MNKNKCRYHGNAVKTLRSACAKFVKNVIFGLFS
jgi:hypothetical protein